MGTSMGLGSLSAQTSALQSSEDRLIQGVKQPKSAVDAAKIDKGAKEFEAVLVGSWLQQAEQSFGSLPGGDDEDTDSGKDQYMGIAMQSLGASLTASGGIGIAKMVAKSLHKAEDVRVALAAKTGTASAK